MNHILTNLKGRYSCPVCSARFTELADKKRHIKTEHKDTR